MVNWLLAQGPGNRPFVTYQYYKSVTGTWEDVPVAHVVRQGSTTRPVWPMARETTGFYANGFQPLTWDLAATRANIDGRVRVRAALRTTTTDSAPVYTNVNAVQLATHAFGGSYDAECRPW